MDRLIKNQSMSSTRVMQQVICRTITTTPDGRRRDLKCLCLKGPGLLFTIRMSHYCYIFPLIIHDLLNYVQSKIERVIENRKKKIENKPVLIVFVDNKIDTRRYFLQRNKKKPRCI